MRVCMLHNRFWRSSGSAIAIRRIVQSMEHCDVEFFFAGCAAPIPGGAIPVEDIEALGADRYRVFHLITSNPFLLLNEIREFAKWLKEIRCDIVHTHHRRLAAIGQVMSHFLDIQVIYTCHNVFPAEAWFKILSPANATAVSTSCANYLLRETNAKRAEVIPNPYVFPALSDAGAGTPNRVVSIGRLDPIKGHIHLIQACKILRDRGIDFKLDIFGEGYLRSDLESKIKAEGLEKSVALPGYSSSLSSVLQQSSFNVLVSETEGFPNSVIEAAALARPTLLTDVEGSRDTLPHSLSLPNGLRFGDVLQLADALTEWLTRPDDVIQDGIGFYNFLAPQCSPEVVSEKYFQLYKRLVHDVR